jgi:hypothetical protein
VDHGPGAVVFDQHGEPESISGAAERWIGELVEEPPPSTPSESKTVQAIAARARAITPGTDPLELAARARARTRSGAWLLLYGTRLSGGTGDRTAVIIHPATPQDVAPVIALSYGPTDRECQVAAQCVQGRVTKDRPRLDDVAVHRAGPPQGDLRQDRCAQPGRAGRADLPRPLRDPLGGPGRRDTWPAGARHLTRRTLTPAAQIVRLSGRRCGDVQDCLGECCRVLLRGIVPDAWQFAPVEAAGEQRLVATGVIGTEAVREGVE